MPINFFNLYACMYISMHVSNFCKLNDVKIVIALRIHTNKCKLLGWDGNCRNQLKTLVFSQKHLVFVFAICVGV